MDRHTVTAFFEDRENANNAVLRLRRHGVADQDFTISPEAAATGFAEEMPAHVKRYWAAFDSLFGGTDDHPAYAEAVRRGLIMVTAGVEPSRVDDVASVLDRYGSVDLSACEAVWRAEGWTGGSAIPGDRKHLPDAATCAAVGTRAEDRGKVRIHRDRIGMFKDPVHRHGTDPRPGQSTTAPIEDSRTSARASAALTDATTVQRAKNLEVVGSDGQHVGIIDHVAGTVIRLKCGDTASDGIDHVIPTMWVQFIDDKVTLKVTAGDVARHWMVA